MSENLYILGTGNAMVTRCYNTCFAIGSPESYLLVDTGGGNGILRQLEDAQLPVTSLHNIILTHGHNDHIWGIAWVARAIAQTKGYTGSCTIWCHENLAPVLRQILDLGLPPQFHKVLDEQVRIRTVKNGETADVNGHSVTFFDILSTKLEQYGFTMQLKNGKRLVCLGDEPYNPDCGAPLDDADWVLCEAFCLYGDRERFQPYKKHHSTVADAARLAQEHRVKNLVLYHTEDKTLATRKQRYTDEGRQNYTGQLFVPDDLEVLPL